MVPRNFNILKYSRKKIVLTSVEFEDMGLQVGKNGSGRSRKKS